MRGRVCYGCREIEAYRMDAYIMRQRDRSVDPQTGCTMRRCRRCDVVKDQETDFYRTGDGHFQGICKPCTIARAREARAAKRAANPEREREKRNAEARASYARNPERHRAAGKRAYARMKADSARLAREREMQRIRYRLRQEKKGLTPASRKPMRATTIAKKRWAPRRLPSEPLLRFVEGIVAHREQIEGLLQDAAGATVAATCQDLGLSPRDYRRWKAGDQPTVHVGLAERILLNADVEWHEVYSYDDYAHVFLPEEVMA